MFNNPTEWNLRSSLCDDNELILLYTVSIEFFSNLIQSLFTLIFLFTHIGIFNVFVRDQVSNFKLHACITVLPFLINLAATLFPI